MKSNNKPMTQAQLKAQEKLAQIHSLRLLFAGEKSELTFSDASLGVVVFSRVRDDGKIISLGFSGKRTKPDYYYQFATAERANLYFTKWYEALCKQTADKAERKALTQNPQTVLAVGDVLVSSWGYDQTNYDYYEVTKLIGKRSVEIRELMQQRTGSGSMEGDCVPLKGKFAGEPMIKRVNAHGSVKVRDWGVWATKKEVLTVAGIKIFKPDNYTAYA
jgi:hypothetical protein